MKKVVISTLILIFALQASDNMWWNEPAVSVDEESEPMLGDITSGERKMLIIVSKFPEDTAVLRPALYDSLIAPSIDSLDDSLYRWSVTDFLYTASWKQLKMTGEVNPFYTFPFYVTAPHSLQWYRDRFSFGVHTGNIIDTFERDIIGVVDDFFDFNDYDANNDGCVDFVYFIHPLCPNKGFVQDTFDTPDSSNYGFATGYPCLDTDDSLNNAPIKINRRARCGSSMSYYHPDSTKRIDRKAATNLICHEFGHALGHQYVGSHLKGRDGKFIVQLPDRYDQPTNSNLYAGSGGVGKYTVMQLGYYYTHPHLYTPWERMVLGWIEPVEITENSQNVILKDFNAYSTDLSQKAYVIPVDSVEVDSASQQIGYHSMWLREYFLVTNYQPSTHWLDDLGETWLDDIKDPGPDPDAHGVLVWHVNERFWDWDSVPSELMPFEDLECAEGLMNLTGDGPSPMGTIIGWDRIDRWCHWAEKVWPVWNKDIVNASTSHPHDFFNPAYKDAFHTLTNPSSDGYNCDPRAYGGHYIGLKYTYPSEGSGGSEAEERLVLQNLPTHVALEGIEYNGGTEIKLCIRRSRIWIDQPTAMDRTTQRKFICDTTDTFHFVYPLKGNIYYTRTHAPDSIWYKAEKVGPHPVFYDSIGHGIWPALTLDEEREPLVVFYDTSCSEVIYSYREESWRTVMANRRPDTIMDTVWHSPPCTLDLAGDPGPVAIDYGFGDGFVVNPDGEENVSRPQFVGALKGTVHLAYLTRVGNHDELHYAHFPKYHPESIADETLESNLAIDNNRDMGVSIEVDILNDKICIAYGCYKDTLGRGDTLPAIYYRERVDTFGWTPAYPFDFTLNSPTISRTSGEPLVPFIDPDDGYLRIVLNANDKILFNAKTCSDAFYNWSDTFIVVAQDSNQNRYPQIGGNMITWTKVVGADSNVYACKTPLFNEFKLSIYPEENWFCHVTKADTSAACLYQQGTFHGPKWAVYYRGPCGFGGNQESDGPGSRLIPTEPEFSMSVSRNILRGNQFSVFTTDECELAAYDVTGRRIAKFTIEAQPLGGEVETPIDCRNWASGIYFLRAVHEGESFTVIRTEKVVLLR